MELPNKILMAAVAMVLVLPVVAFSQSGAKPGIELEGTISSVSGTQIRLFDGLVTVEARGARIEAEDEDFTNISDLKPGTAIEIRATENADGSLQSTEVEVSDEKDDHTEVVGVIGTVDLAGRTFTIGPITITWHDRTKFKDISAPAAGRLVEVEVEISGGRLIALAVEREEADD